MLILKRRKGQKIRIGNDITVVVTSVDDNSGQQEVAIGIDAPNHITIDREEVHERRIARIERVVNNGKD